jgi:hypothetical protein
MNSLLYKHHRIGYKKSKKKSKKTKSPSISPPPPKKKNKKSSTPASKQKSSMHSASKEQQMESNLLPVTAGTSNSVETTAFVMTNYNSKLGEFTNEWDMVNDDGVGLHIGVLNYNNTKTSTFRSHEHARDVKAALSMLSYLFLENYHVSQDNSLLFDSGMLLVKQSSSGLNIHFIQLES